MKKLLLLTTAALLGMSASAQLAVQDEAVENTDPGQVAAAPAINADTKPAPGYVVPTGTFFSGYAKGAYRLNNPILHTPAYVDLTFVNVSKDATSYLWNYVNPEGEYNFLNPQLESTATDLSVNYGYADPTTIEAPTLTATNELGDSTTSLETNTPVYMRVGGPSTQGSANAEYTYYGWQNASPLGGTLYYSSNRFATNHPSSNSAWANTAGFTTASVRGFGEVYFAPARPYALTGFACHVREISPDNAPMNSPVTMTVYKVDLTPGGYYVDGSEEKICSQTLSPDDFEMAGTNRLYLTFDQLVDAETGEVAEGYTIDFPIMVTLTLPEGDQTAQMGAYYNAITVNIPTHNYVILDGSQEDGTEVTGYIRYAGLNYTNGTYARSFSMFSIMGSFEYLFDEDGNEACDYEETDLGGSKSFTLASSKSYEEFLLAPSKRAFGDPNWKFTQADGSELPEWITVNAVDNTATVDGETVYTHATGVTISLSANTGAERTCAVNIGFLGANYTVNVSQEGVTTGIEDVTVAEDDANAPTYNVMGQRVSADTKGLLIRGGKKILVK